MGNALSSLVQALKPNISDLNDRDSIANQHEYVQMIGPNS